MQITYNPEALAAAVGCVVYHTVKEAVSISPYVAPCFHSFPTLMIYLPLRLARCAGSNATRAALDRTRGHLSQQQPAVDWALLSRGEISMIADRGWAGARLVASRMKHGRNASRPDWACCRILQVRAYFSDHPPRHSFRMCGNLPRKVSAVPSTS